MKEKILQIKSEHPDWGYQKIASFMGCSKNNVKYHLSPSQRDYYKSKRRENKRKRMTELKLKHGGKCKICEYNKCFDALQFHHTNPSNKIGEVSKLYFSKSKKAAFEEADKCILICANCHAEIHSKLVEKSSN